MAPPWRWVLAHDGSAQGGRPDVADSVGPAKNWHMFWHTLKAFLTMPAATRWAAGWPPPWRQRTAH